MDLVETMFSARERPWHGKGVITANALSAEDALLTAGLNWNVDLRPVSVNGLVLQDWLATTRSTDGRVLGIVGKKYVPVQNEELFEFFDPVVERKEAIYETAGSLKDGRIVWLLAKLKGEHYVDGVPDDVVHNYVLLTTAHDGTMAVIAQHTPVRVVCWNTLSAALSGYQSSVRIHHNTNALFGLRQAHAVLGLATRRMERFMELAGYLATVRMNRKKITGYVRAIFPSKRETEDKTAAPQTVTRRNRVIELLEAETNKLPGMEHTAWAMWNAAVEYYDHDQPARKGTDTLHRMWLGTVDRKKRMAMSVLLNQVGEGNDIVNF